jgi:hypothetical protein
VQLRLFALKLRRHGERLPKAMLRSAILGISLFTASAYSKNQQQMRWLRVNIQLPRSAQLPRSTGFEAISSFSFRVSGFVFFDLTAIFLLAIFLYGQCSRRQQ